METQTIIGEDISITGEIHGKGDLLIKGSVKGKIELENGHVTVGSKGQVEAEIHAGNVNITGRMIGNIKALDKMEIRKEADFNGEIKAKRILVEDGAYLKGVIELEREPEKKAKSTIKPVDHAASGANKNPPLWASKTDNRK